MTDDANRWAHDEELDFGDDADAELPADPEFDAWLERSAPSINPPVGTPRAEMWDAIAAALSGHPSANEDRVVRVIPMRRRRWILPSVIAAALLVGIGVDRYLVRADLAPIARPEGTRVSAAPPRTTPSPEPRTSAPAGVPDRGTRVASTARVTQPTSQVGAPRRVDSLPMPSGRFDSIRNRAADSSSGSSHLFRLAAVQTLSQAEALLTAYRASGIAERDPAAARQLAVWGRDVLSSTRLLLDSPAGDDPSMRQLLQDLELVLVQIIRLSGAPLEESERTLIDRALRERDLLPRIRTMVPAGIAAGASSD